MNLKEERDLEQEFLWRSLDHFDKEIDKAPLPIEVERLEVDRIVTSLSDYKGNRSKAAKSLGIGRTNLIAKIKKYKL